MKPTALCLAVVALLAPLAPAQTKRAMTFADLSAMKRVSDPQISPSGKWVLFSVTDVSLGKNSKTTHLWIVPIGGGDDGAKEQQVSDGPGESNGRFSPDGKWVLYSSSGSSNGSSNGGSNEGNSTPQIWLAPWNDDAGMLGTGHPVTALAMGTDGGIWAPDSVHFLFTSEVYPECESHAAMGPQRNSDEAGCNALKAAFDTANPVKAQLWTHLLYRHWSSYQGATRSHIFYGAVDGSAPEDLTPASVIGDHVAPTFSLGGPLGYAISPDGKQVAYVVNLDKVPAESTNNDIYTLAVGAEPGTAKRVSTSPGSDDGPQYSPDGKWLAWRSQAQNGYESDKFNLVVMDRNTGTIQNLTKGFENWVDSFQWLDDSQHLWFTSPLHGEEILYRTDVTGDDLHAMSKGGGEWGDFLPVLLNGHEHAVGSRMWVNQPSEIFNVDALELDDSADVTIVRVGKHPVKRESSESLSSASTGQLTHLNDALVSELSMTPLEPFWFPGANGTTVEGFLIKPPNFDPHKKYPLKFLIHGGPQGAWGDDWSYRWNPELFAADGYVVVMINPRGSTGYGQKFLEEVSGDWGGRPYIDLMKGLDYAEQHYPFIDKSRECALGASYGGYMADWVLTHTNRFKCIVTHDGMSDPAAAFGATEELWFPEWEFRPLDGRGPDAVVEQQKPSHPWDFYGKPEMDDPYIKWSPMRFIKNARTPTLVVHSQHDYRLDVSQGLELFTALQLLHVPSEMLYFPDESHWVQKPQNSELWYRTVDDWCDRWTGSNKYASVGPEKNPASATAVSSRPSHRKRLRKG